jgi:hypothetical protein
MPRGALVRTSSGFRMPTKTLKHRWKRWKARPAARRAMRGRLSQGWPQETAAYERLRAAGLSDRQAVAALVAALERQTDRMVDSWTWFDDVAYHADLERLGR